MSNITAIPAAAIIQVLPDMPVTDMPVILPEDIPVLEIPKQEVSKQEETTTEESGRDQATLSAESKNYNYTPEQFQEKLKAELEFLNQLLLMLQNFTVSGSDPLLADLDKLLALYHNFLKQSMACVDKEIPAALRHQCQNHLTSAIIRLIQTHLPELDSFFQNYGTPAIRENIKSAFLSYVTGERSISQPPPNVVPSKTGVLYQKSAHYLAPNSTPKRSSAVLPHEASLSALKTPKSFEQKQNFYMDIPRYDKKIAQRAVQRLNSTEQFVTYIKQSETLSTISDMPIKDEGVLGVAKADLLIKTQIFSENAKLPSSESSALRSAVDKFIDYHISSTSRKTLRAYTSTMKQYQSSGSPKSALEHGLKQVAEQMEQELKADISIITKKDTLTSPQAIMPDIIRLLKNDWRQFLAALPNDYDSAFKKIFSHHSLWAASIETGAVIKNHIFLRPAVIKAICIAAIAAFCLLMLL